MGYLHFDNSLVQNLGKALLMEDLSASRSGAYRCGTICGCNTRKYHGELIVPTDIEGKSNLVLVSTLDETLFQHGVGYNIGVHEYGAGKCVPEGHNYIKEVEVNKGTKTILRVGGVLLEKVKIMAQDAEQMIVRYRVLDSRSQATLRVNPLLAFRDSSELCLQNNVANGDAKKVAGGFSACLYKGFPTLFVQTNVDSAYNKDVHWVNGVHYFNESDRGYHDREDLLSVGNVEFSINSGESVYLSLSTSLCDQKSIAAKFEETYKNLDEKNDYLSALKSSAKNHIFNKGKETLLKSVFPWNNKVDARDMLISIPGVTLYSDNAAEFDTLLKSVVAVVEAQMAGKSVKTSISGATDPDVMLWLIWAIQKDAEVEGIKKAWKKYGALVKSIIDYIANDKHVNIEATESGLLYIHAWQVAQTWMNAKTAMGTPVTPRSGFVVEINALWYNALMFAVEAMNECNEGSQSDSYETLADKVGEAFSHTFWNGTYLHDFVDGDHYEMSVRPNMLFAVSLKYSPLEYSQKKAVVDMASKELLISMGIRTLSPNSNNFHGSCQGGELSRGYAAFQGSAYPWLMGAFVEAYLRVYKKSGLLFVESCLGLLQGDMFNGTLGTFSELYDAMPAHKGKEGMSSIKNIAEVLRAEKLIANYKA